MNIFILDINPKNVAKFHCDKHVVKMIVETAQMLSTTHYILNSSLKHKVYKPAYINHPCTKWVRKSKGNYIWTLELLAYLLTQYKIRYKKIHKTFEIYRYLCNYPRFKKKNMTNFVLAMPDKYKSKCVIKSYRTYYLNDKKSFAKWEKGIEAPWWWKNETNN